MSKKNVLVASHNLRIGGVERSLIGLLWSFDFNRNNVDLLLNIHDGELMDLIPKEVNLLPELKKYSSLLQPVKWNLSRGYFDILRAKVKARREAKAFIAENALEGDDMVYANYLYEKVMPLLPNISAKQYDLGISFLTPHYFCANKVNARKRIAWIHTDYSKMMIDREAELKMWGQYDFIASISDDSAKVFQTVFPELADKVVVIENIFHPESIRKQAAQEGIPKEMEKVEGQWRLLSIGRFCRQKNFDNVPYICKHLLESGLDVKWFLIGFGGDEELIRESIKSAGVEENVIILGKKTNPYPFIQACDIYVQPSRFEGKAVTVREAQTLAKPVIITDFDTSKSQLRNGVDGIIVPLENEECARGIADLIHNKALQEALSENCRKTDYGNADEIEKIYSLL